MNFNREVLVSNLEFLLESNRIKPSTLDAHAKMSVGYTTRLFKKDSKTIPGIDYIMVAAEVLKASINVMLTVDLKSLNNTDRYKLNVETKLNEDTLSGKLQWKVYSMSDILNPNGLEFLASSMRPFSIALFQIKGKTEVVCKSKLANDEYVAVCGACIFTRISAENTMVIIPVFIEGTTESGFNYHNRGYELYISLPKDRVRGVDQVLQGSAGYSEINTLYNLVIQRYEDSLIDNEVKDVMDVFLQEKY